MFILNMCINYITPHANHPSVYLGLTDQDHFCMVHFVVGNLTEF